MESFNIDLKNFQSIAEADLEFTPGINLIVGQSNSGKTAILRAVNAVIDNPTRGKYYIKKGAKSSEVDINYEGNNIGWKRTPSESTYEINGELFKKTGRDNLFDLNKNTGFVTDSSGNVMNIEGEWNLPFPFDRTPSELFKLFENVFCISDSAVILKSFKDEEASIVKDKLVQEDKLARLNKKHDALKELETEINIPKYSKKLKIFKKNTERYKEIIADIKKIENSERFSKVNVDEVTPPIEDNSNSYVEALKDYKFLVKVIQRQKFFKSLPASVIVGDTIDKYVQAREDYSHLIHAKELKNIDLSKECNVDGSTISKYVETYKDYEELKRLSNVSEFDIIKECNVDNTLEEYEVLLQDIKFISRCYDKCKELKGKYLAIENKVTEAQEKLSRYKVCPLCGHELGD